jgi:hypothetical protein
MARKRRPINESHKTPEGAEETLLKQLDATPETTLLLSELLSGYKYPKHNHGRGRLLQH